VVHLHATIQQHKLEITVADREHQIPPDRPQDHLGVELPPFEGLILPYPDSLSTFGHPRRLPDQVGAAKLQQNRISTVRPSASLLERPTTRRR
jgi:hypothetical protein